MTVGQFLFDSLKNEGVTEIFGVPGDYNFALLDILEHDGGVNFVACRNELNAGYAADGYARVKGLGAVVTTFGVGELSACNAIAGSFSESVPVVHIVGAPKSAPQKQHKLLHHTLMDGDFSVFMRMYGHITAYAAAVTADNAVLEIPAAIQKAKETKKPVYLSVATDVASQEVVPRTYAPAPAATDGVTLSECLAKINALLGQARSPVLISETLAMRFGQEGAVAALAQKLNVPVVTMMTGKGSFDESRGCFAGFYCGALGSDDVRSLVESADLVLAVGAVWNDYNTGLFTAKLDPLRVIDIQPSSARVGMAVYENVMMPDVLQALTASAVAKSAPPLIAPPYGEVSGNVGDAVAAASYYPRFQRMIREGDIVVAEAGTIAWGMAGVRLKRGVTYIAQGAWGCIGYALPAAFGACVAAPGRRVLLFTGDGSLQLTAQEMSSMLANGCRPIVFVLNNRGYTIEKNLNLPSFAYYNDIPNWDYTKLPEAFGHQVFSVRVATLGELDAAIAEAEAQSASKLCLIEMAADPVDAPEIIRKVHRVTLEMQ